MSLRPNNNIDNKINIGVELLNESVNLYNDGKFNIAYEKYLIKGENKKSLKKIIFFKAKQSCRTMV